MPYKDRDKRNKVARESAERIYSDEFGVRIRRDYEIHDYFAEAREKYNLPMGQYAIMAILEKILREEQLSPEEASRISGLIEKTKLKQ